MDRHIHLNANKSLISCTITCYRHTGCLARRQENKRITDVTIPGIVRNVKKQIKQQQRDRVRKKAIEPKKVSTHKSQRVFSLSRETIEKPFLIQQFVKKQNSQVNSTLKLVLEIVNGHPNFWNQICFLIG